VLKVILVHKELKELKVHKAPQVEQGQLDLKVAQVQLEIPEIRVFQVPRDHKELKVFKGPKVILV
jgi:hypothetical protein